MLECLSSRRKITHPCVNFAQQNICLCLERYFCYRALQQGFCFFQLARLKQRKCLRDNRVMRYWVLFFHVIFRINLRVFVARQTCIHAGHVTSLNAKEDQSQCTLRYSYSQHLNSSAVSRQSTTQFRLKALIYDGRMVKATSISPLAAIHGHRSAIDQSARKQPFSS